MQHTTGDVVAVIDGDLQYPPEEIRDCWRRLSADFPVVSRASSVVGSPVKEIAAEHSCRGDGLVSAFGMLFFVMGVRLAIMGVLGEYVGPDLHRGEGPPVLPRRLRRIQRCRASR